MCVLPSSLSLFFFFFYSTRHQKAFPQINVNIVDTFDLLHSRCLYRRVFNGFVQCIHVFLFNVFMVMSVNKFLSNLVKMITVFGCFGVFFF